MICGGSGTHFTRQGSFPVSEEDVFVIKGDAAHGSQYLAVSLFMQAIHRLSQWYGLQQSGLPYKPAYKIAPALSHIEQNFAADISVPELTGMSESSLLRSFRHIRASSMSGLQPEMGIL